MTGLVGWPALALFSFGLRDRRLRVGERVDRGLLGDWRTVESGRRLYRTRVKGKLGEVEKGDGEKGVLPSLRGGHAAAQAAAPLLPAPRHARAWCLGGCAGRRPPDSILEREKGTECLVTGEPEESAAVCRRLRCFSASHRTSGTMPGRQATGSSLLVGLDRGCRCTIVGRFRVPRPRSV